MALAVARGGALGARGRNLLRENERRRTGAVREGAATRQSGGGAEASGAKRKNYGELIKRVEQENKLKERTEPPLRVGDPVEVGVTVVENNRSRVQPFQGTIMAINKRGENSTVRVRRVSGGYGVERVFPLNSPLVTFRRIPQPGEPVVRRAKLYFLRQRRGKSARLKLRFKARKDRKDTKEME